MRTVDRGYERPGDDRVATPDEPPDCDDDVYGCPRLCTDDTFDFSEGPVLRYDCVSDPRLAC